MFSVLSVEHKLEFLLHLRLLPSSRYLYLAGAEKCSLGELRWYESYDSSHTTLSLSPNTHNIIANDMHETQTSLEVTTTHLVESDPDIQAKDKQVSMPILAMNNDRAPEGHANTHQLNTQNKIESPQGMHSPQHAYPLEIDDFNESERLINTDMDT